MQPTKCFLFSCITLSDVQIRLFPSGCLSLCQCNQAQLFCRQILLLMDSMHRLENGSLVGFCHKGISICGRLHWPDLTYLPVHLLYVKGRARLIFFIIEPKLNWNHLYFWSQWVTCAIQVTFSWPNKAKTYMTTSNQKFTELLASIPFRFLNLNQWTYNLP